ncbi:hypothetical protein P4637_04575 [Halalkalibacterium halodurans]|uniref:BH3879 protein n=1 Tax=Halalkalibacterium halodurans (strain ATCC BAA-125 / DSM 18197 / FERM 7344 / JCM 9153 / C-125) TaxID=272558 RepID=Q9K653_HALH5|nr:hypothetical protein [Halalkalibacterium halodurans]MED3645847.1 hypothetical protein [Halalkalibacterium halodurans]MED4079587.1 hypothetical protein [Halalkalibacterium halodurans]MED4084136.1 hypothetical protein [Halalkalibacterium halodurans]MED4104614.1 hypothetical protein [Halalkalibacterium halodurans]MED4108342.1 hypothetical protein [Halalkalibacterium halodurans]
MEGVMSFLFGALSLFYPLLIASVLLFGYAFVKRSWVGMVVCAILLYPNAWFVSMHPPFPWVIYTPVIPIMLAAVFYLMKRTRLRTN